MFVTTNIALLSYSYFTFHYWVIYKMKFSKVLLLSVLFSTLLPLTTVQAASKLKECKSTDEGELSRCLDGNIDLLDRELQTWVNLHVFNLEEKALVNGRYSALKMFKRAQTNFITFRENNCRWHYLAVSPEKGANLAYKRCYIALSQMRITGLSLTSAAQTK